MDPLMMALLVGFFGICIVWTVSSNYVRRHGGCQGSCAEEGAQPDGDREEPSQEEIDATYRRIFHIRILGLVLCLLAVAVLYFGLHSGLALLLAAAGCITQYLSFRIRYRHLQHRRLVPDREKRA